jgi:hypothetical protein
MTRRTTSRLVLQNRPAAEDIQEIYRRAERFAGGSTAATELRSICDRRMRRSASFIHADRGLDVSIHLSGRGRAAAALLVVFSFAACSGSAATAAPGGASGGTGATGSSPAPAATSASASSAPVIAGGGSDAHYCAEMKLADAQALVKVPIAAAQTGGPLGCAFVLPGQDINGDNLTVSVYPGDSDKTYYNDSVSGPVSSSPNPIPGVGDVTVWEQPAGSASAPEVIAHGGSLTCVVQPPADTSQLTVDQTGNGPLYQISETAAAAYAAKEAVLCADMFAAGG